MRSPGFGWKDVQGLFYCAQMKNITVTVHDDVYRRARVKAAERDTSVSALVREFLESLGAGETEFERRCRLEDEVIASIRRFRAEDRLDRDAVHRRKPPAPWDAGNSCRRI